ncbi:uncharacterized protein LOC131315971 [Rhododendron vialii]|uniref:uncharacterized protein LOC131315971 n=1 Tax=Rhododendron vialii TaxID=182163 RepID=UPI00265D85A8|nr:uncharacterized protein LOC131315971 [Rhododendron vialii]
MLATRNTSSFIFDPHPLPEVTALQLWCAANATKIRELPIAPVPQLPMPKVDEHSEDDITKLANLPMSVEKTQYLNVQGITKVTDFAQIFYYLACSICKRATNAYGNGGFWCNYCAKKVPALTK